jgi:hypothetical protein
VAPGFAASYRSSRTRKAPLPRRSQTRRSQTQRRPRGNPAKTGLDRSPPGAQSESEKGIADLYTPRRRIRPLVRYPASEILRYVTKVIGSHGVYHRRIIQQGPPKHRWFHYQAATIAAARLSTRAPEGEQKTLRGCDRQTDARNGQVVIGPVLVARNERRERNQVSQQPQKNLAMAAAKTRTSVPRDGCGKQDDHRQRGRSSEGWPVGGQHCPFPIESQGGKNSHIKVEYLNAGFWDGRGGAERPGRPRGRPIAPGPDRRY